MATIKNVSDVSQVIGPGGPDGSEPWLAAGIVAVWAPQEEKTVPTDALLLSPSIDRLLSEGIFTVTSISTEPHKDSSDASALSTAAPTSVFTAGGGLIHLDVTQSICTASPSTQDLKTYLLPASTLKAGHGIQIKAWGFGPSQQTSMNLIFGGTNLGNFDVAGGIFGGAWEFSAEIYFGADGNHQVSITRGEAAEANTTYVTFNQSSLAILAAGAPTEDVTTAIPIIVRATGLAAPGDQVCAGLSVGLI